MILDHYQRFGGDGERFSDVEYYGADEYLYPGLADKTKQNKKPSSKFLKKKKIKNEGLCFFHCGIVKRNGRVFFFFFF